VPNEGLVKLFNAHVEHRLGKGAANNMALLFHKSNETASILMRGFQPICSSVNGNVFGKGTYFTDDPGKAADYGVGNVFIVSVVFLGNCVHMEGKTTTSLMSKFDEFFGPQSNDRNTLFDSGYGINIFRGRYAEYVIYGNPNGVSCVDVPSMFVPRMSVCMHVRRVKHPLTHSLHR
jgi:hypothetical protein